jgi:hypothetical protein
METNMDATPNLWLTSGNGRKASLFDDINAWELLELIGYKSRDEAVFFDMLNGYSGSWDMSQETHRWTWRYSSKVTCKDQHCCYILSGKGSWHTRKTWCWMIAQVTAMPSKNTHDLS